MTHRKTESERELSPRKTNGADPKHTYKHNNLSQGETMNIDREFQSRGTAGEDDPYYTSLMSLCKSVHEWYADGYFAIPFVRLDEWVTPEGCAELTPPIATFPFAAMVIEHGLPSRVVSLYYNSDFPLDVSTELLSEFCNEHGIVLLPIQSRPEYSRTYSALSFFEQTLHSFPETASKLCCQVCQSPLALRITETDRKLSRLPSLVCTGTQRTGDVMETYCNRMIIGLDDIHDMIETMIGSATKHHETIIRETFKRATKKSLYVNGLEKIAKMTARFGMTVEDLVMVRADEPVE